MRRALRFSALFTALAFPFRAVAAPDVVAIGDSLTAEYDTIPVVPGFSAEATAYAEVTVNGWVSMSWVEVAARLQRAYFDFGSSRPLSAPWGIPRLSGYEHNWAVPGILASQYEDFMTSSVLQNFAYFSLRQPLESQLKSPADRVVIWLGANEFRANYGRLYDGGSSKALIDGLLGDLGRIVDAVKKRNSKLQIVIANIPDLGATPSKKAAHPDATKRARVTAATVAANTRIADLAKKKGIGLADVYALTAALVRNAPPYLGAVRLVNDEDPDNEPRHAFTRDGLHPNTCLQIFNARTIAAAFNTKYKAGIPTITDAQALALLGINPNQPFYDWLESYGIEDRSFVADSDEDGVTQLVEYAFRLAPTADDADEIDVTIGGAVPGIVGTKSVLVKPDPARLRHVRVAVQYSSDGARWLNVPASNIVKKSSGAFVAVIPPGTGRQFLRLRVSTIPPSGSTASVASELRFE
jgi:hypothetical protein